MPATTRSPSPGKAAAARALGALACACWLASPARSTELMSAAHASIRAADAARHVAALADDSFEGREGGTRGGRAAAAYIVDLIGKLGLEPAGDAGSFYQPFGGMRNVLGLLRGSDPQLAHEVVVVSAHYDHVGYGNADNSYGPFGFVHNGADDNASGVAGLIEVIEAMQHLRTRPRRSILFAFWDGEEKGLLGSYHFLRTRPAALADMQTVFCVNLDMIGRLRGNRLEVYGSRTSPGLRSAVVAANNRPGTGAELDLAFNWDIEDDSDHYPFIAARVPTIMFHTGLHDQYHRPSDDAHLVNTPGIEPIARLTLGFVTAIASEPGPARTFRPECRSESNASRNTLEAAVPATAESRGRWGIGTRHDPAEPTLPVVVRVWPDSPAAKAGLLPGDRLQAIDGAEIVDQADMLARLKSSAATTSIVVERRGRVIELEMRSDRD